MSIQPLTISMKGAIGLMISFILFLVVGAAVALLTGPMDIYILLSMIFPVLYIILIFFCWKRKPWAYLGSMILGIFVVVAVPASIGSEMSPLLIWETSFATILSVLIALESFKAYSESKKP